MNRKITQQLPIPAAWLFAALAFSLTLSSKALASEVLDNDGVVTNTLNMGLEVPLKQSAGGTLYLTASAAGVAGDFLLDTGAGMVTLSQAMFDKLQRARQVEHVREMAARLANNRFQRVDVYRVSDFRIGECRLGTVEVAVMEGGSRNLLGLSALGLAAPFAIQLAPPSLSLSQCGLQTVASLGG
jgi:predicted aspartyl protease